MQPEKSRNLNRWEIIYTLFCFLLLGCTYLKYHSPIKGEWQMIDWNGEGKPALDISLTFKNYGEYQDSRTEDALWNYDYFEPDSLILYHHGLYEERHKILTLTNDTLSLRLFDVSSMQNKTSKM